MSKVIIGMSRSLDGVASGITEVMDADTINLERTHLSGSAGVTHLRSTVVRDQETPDHETRSPKESS